MSKKPTIENCRIFTVDDYDVLVREFDKCYYFYLSDSGLETEFRYIDNAKIEEFENAVDIQDYIAANINKWTEYQFGCFVN